MRILILAVIFALAFVSGGQGEEAGSSAAAGPNALFSSRYARSLAMLQADFPVDHAALTATAAAQEPRFVGAVESE